MTLRDRLIKTIDEFKSCECCAVDTEGLVDHILSNLEADEEIEAGILFAIPKVYDEDLDFDDRRAIWESSKGNKKIKVFIHELDDALLHKDGE